MTLDVNSLRRRPPGPRTLVYLDQSTLSSLVSDERYAEVRELLRRGVRQGRVVCPSSLGHTAETLAAAKSWEDITKLTFELSMGVAFRSNDEVVRYELSSAAAAFLGRPARELWQDAFETDPHTPRSKLFQGGFAVHAYFPPDEFRLAETAHAKASEQQVQTVYEAVRRDGVSFATQAEREFDGLVRWRLGPLVDGENFEAFYERRKNELVAEWLTTEGIDNSPGSRLNRFLNVSIEKSLFESFLGKYPELSERGEDFAASAELRRLPSLRYPALLRAGLAVMPGRKAKPGDGYDIWHLTLGLSRCDIVTADAGMTQLALERGLVPDGCQLLRCNDVASLTGAIEQALAQPGFPAAA